MRTKRRIVAVSSMCPAVFLVVGALAGSPAHADDALLQGVNGLRPGCPPIVADPRLSAAAQRHANDMLATGVGGHAGSDGSSPRARITAAGYTAPGSTGEIVFWGTGAAANSASALDWWMNSPPHRALIVNCAFTAAGVATARNGTKLTAVVEFGTG
ncbi:CAP domain-containing protein [Mycolicibacterium sp.]|uniref:CAP domain-containing protein n=1 Tax=Mycolicibacterium sp. TaxID=2320850 RepID=UPI003560869C